MSRDSTDRVSRRRLLAATAGVVALAGCAGSDDNSGEESSDPTETAESETLTDGLKLWLRPDSETVTTEGSVEVWRDDSGNSNDISQDEAESRPSLVADAVNGHSALRFDGENDYLLREDSLGIADDSGRTFVVVSRLTDLAARSPFLVQGTFGSTGGNSNYYGLEANTYNTSGERFCFYVTSVGKESGKSTNDTYNVHVLQSANFPELSAIESSTSYFVNGEELSYETTQGNARNSPFESDATALGAFPQSAPETILDGEIAEIRVYDRVLTESERSSLETTLLEKYALTES